MHVLSYLFLASFIAFPVFAEYDTGVKPDNDNKPAGYAPAAPEKVEGYDNKKPEAPKRPPAKKAPAKKAPAKKAPAKKAPAKKAPAKVKGDNKAKKATKPKNADCDKQLTGCIEKQKKCLKDIVALEKEEAKKRDDLKNQIKKLVDDLYNLAHQYETKRQKLRDQMKAELDNEKKYKKKCGAPKKAAKKKPTTVKPDAKKKKPAAKKKPVAKKPAAKKPVAGGYGPKPPAPSTVKPDEHDKKPSYDITPPKY